MAPALVVPLVLLLGVGLVVPALLRLPPWLPPSRPAAAPAAPPAGRSLPRPRRAVPVSAPVSRGSRSVLPRSFSL
ncbi:hypothetical protein C3R44_23450, partial [Mycobacterium tuberculosis]